MEQIRNRNPKELAEQQAPYNPRRISTEEMEQLKASIQAFGFVVPVLINKTTGKVVAGHQRIAAAAALGLAEIPTIEIEASEEHEKVLNIALNRIKGKFDLEKLDKIFTELVTRGENTAITGFSELDQQTIKVALAGKAGPPPYQQIQFQIEKRKIPDVRAAIRASRGKGPFTEYESENVNSNGNALARIAEQINKEV